LRRMFNIFILLLCNRGAKATFGPPCRSSAASDDETGRRGDLFPRLEVLLMTEDRKIRRERAQQKSSTAAMVRAGQRAAASSVAKSASWAADAVD
jgi:hypothetical protein